MTMEITQVIEQLKTQLTETEADAERLRTAIAALEGSVQSTPAPSRGRRSARGRATRQRTSNGRSGKVALTPDVVVKLVTPEGVPAREIRSQVNGSDNQVLKVLKDLESAGKVKRSGQRRATKWHLVTDNGRSTARASKPTRRARQPKPAATTA